jgi:ABC-type polysaccharide/polyol phosphate export permease
MYATDTGLRGYLAAIWKCRYFWMSLVKMDLRTRYRRSVLGIGWSLLHPLAMTAILCGVFSQIFSEDVRGYCPYLLSGLAFWNFINAAIRDGCHSLFQGEAYIRQYPAPIAIYPLRIALGGCFHFFLAFLVVLLLTGVLSGFSNPLALLSLLPCLVLFFLLAWSLAILAGFANVYFPDTQHLSEVVLQIFFYATPILYPPNIIKNRWVAGVLHYNPLTPFLRILREPILNGTLPSPTVYAVACGIVLVVGCAAVTALARLQRRLIFHL